MTARVEVRRPNPAHPRQTIHHATIEPEDQWEVSVTCSTDERRATPGGRWHDCSSGRGEAALLVTEFEEGWDRGRAETLAALAERWHLNCLRAGCAHQTVVYETGKYGNRQPSLDLTPPCPLTGYRYGHAWLVEPLPADVLALARSFQ